MNVSQKNNNMDGEFVKVSFSFHFPPETWIAKIAELFPHIQFLIQSLILISPARAICLMQVNGVNLKQFQKKFISTYDKKMYNIIFQDNTTIIFNIIIPNPWVVKSMFDFHIHLLYPISIQQEIVTVHAMAQRKNLKDIFQNSKWKGLHVQINKIENYCQESLLSPRQNEILNQILEKGYFEIPRTKSLTDIANEMNMSPSALSENIRRITKKLAKFYQNCMKSPDNF